MDTIDRENTLKEIEDLSKYIIDTDNSLMAKQLSKALESLIKKNYFFGLQNQKVEIIFYQLNWIALDLLKREEVLDLFSGHLQVGLDLNFEQFNFWSKLKAYLVSLMDYKDRDNIKLEIMQILNKSQAKLIKPTVNNQPILNTVEEWIKKYISYIGLGAADIFKINQFFTESKEYNSLANIEKIKVKNFFEFYERLKKSSFTIEGIEESFPVDEPDFKGWVMNGQPVRTELEQDVKNISEIVRNILGNKKTIKSGSNQGNLVINLKPGGIETNQINPQIEQKKISEQPTPQPPRNTRIDELKDMAGRYPEGSLERRMIEQEIKKLNN